MKKLTLIVSAIFLMASNVYALDLSQFEGVWKGDTNETEITVKDGVLRLNHLDGDEEDFDILSEGETVLDEEIVVKFSSGSIDDKSFLITVILDFSNAKEVKLPQMPGMISLKILEGENKLRYQSAGIGYSSVDGLWTDTETRILEKVK